MQFSCLYIITEHNLRINNKFGFLKKKLRFTLITHSLLTLSLEQDVYNIFFRYSPV